jgi:17beta-estradiol 17-dehydrogenase / very-long-chain 3-oxoacyl-CoA reductase
MLAVYSGSKAFLATFSSALAAEVKQHNITVEHLNTFFVASVSPLGSPASPSTLTDIYGCRSPSCPRPVSLP